MTEDAQQGDPTESRLTTAEATSLLRAGPTHAVEGVGDPPPAHLDALLAGLTPDFRAAVLGEDDRLPRRLAERGGDVRVAPLPTKQGRWQLQAFGPGGELRLTGRGPRTEEARWIPAREGHTPDVASFGLLAPFDSRGLGSSWAAHPRELRSAYLAMMTEPERFYRRLETEARLIPVLRVLQGILAILCGTLTGFFVMQGRPYTFGLTAIASGLLSVACYAYVQRAAPRVGRVVAALGSPPDGP